MFCFGNSMDRPRIFYADHHRLTYALKWVLEADGFTVDTLGGEDAPARFFDENGPSHSLGSYSGLVTHLGVTFIPCVPRLLNKYPLLRIALVSEFPKEYKEVTPGGRVIVCGYDDSCLSSFLRGNLV